MFGMIATGFIQRNPGKSDDYKHGRDYTHCQKPTG
jgi:hypothetical protein